MYSLSHQHFKNLSYVLLVVVFLNVLTHSLEHENQFFPLFLPFRLLLLDSLFCTAQIMGTKSVTCMVKI